MNKKTKNFTELVEDNNILDVKMELAHLSRTPHLGAAASVPAAIVLIVLVVTLFILLLLFLSPERDCLTPSDS